MKATHLTSSRAYGLYGQVIRLAVRTVASALLLAIYCVKCHSATVVLVGGGERNEVLESQVALASRFYGLDLQNVTVRESSDVGQLIAELRKRETVAVILEANVLAQLRQKQVLDALSRRNGRNALMMLVDSGDSKSSSALKQWTAGQIGDCKGRNTKSTDWQLRVVPNADIAAQLSNVALPFRGHIACGMTLAQSFAGRVLIFGSIDGAEVPVFVDVSIGDTHIFAHAGMSPESNSVSAGDDRLVELFTRIAPVMFFLRHAAGNRAWQMVGTYGNLTIDDPWLNPQYGNVRYDALLQEMQTHNFHTTIGFIPWNFKRTHADAGQLFRRYPDRLSVSVHGNNHNHQEFGAYTKHPLAEQAFSVRQALARMDDFSRSTGIAYDPVMIFPHSVAPAGTFHALSDANYMATVNSENVPLGSSEPTDPLFWFRPQTLAFGDIPSLKRYSAEVPVSKTLIAINAYLGNPILFYVHQQFFYPTIGAFNEIADYVNRIAPDIEWRSLGYIAQRLYLIRMIDEGVGDVRAFSRKLCLVNSNNHSVLFRVRRRVDIADKIRLVAVDGAEIPYEVRDNEILFDVEVAPGRNRQVEIAYRSDLSVAVPNVSQRGVVVNTLRRLSDFRDMTLSTNSVGRIMIALYSRFDGVDKQRAAIMILMSAMIALLGRLLYRKRRPHFEESNRTRIL